ncbi:MAG: ThiF family adenylyltransferase [Bryobacterales bacterium]|nr:ThiF family adenylyltransferase [Bryobacterales bacterium]
MSTEPASRYSRQLRFSEWGDEGQRALAEATVVVVGCGALGSFQAAALARAGVGRLRLIDRDYVELSNLQRQWLYDEEAAELVLPKAQAARQEIAKVNREVAVEAVVDDLTARNADEHLAEADLILDGTDNFETRYLINDFAVRDGKPWVYGGAVGSYGLAMPVIPGVTACFRCLYPEAPKGAQPTCETDGVVNTITAIVAAWQVSLSYQILICAGRDWPKKITQFDVWRGETRQIRMPAPSPDCPACGKREFPFLDGSRRAPVSLCGRNAVQIHERQRPIDLQELGARLQSLGTVRANEFALRFTLPKHEITVFPDGRAIIKGTQDIGVARSLYAQYIGA